MKFLKYFKIFEADETENLGDEMLNSRTQDALKGKRDEKSKLFVEFNQKKSKMEAIFKDPKITDDASLENALLKDIYGGKKEAMARNKWLEKFEEVLKMERTTRERKELISKSQDQIKSTNDDLFRLNNEVKDASPKRKLEIVTMINKNKKNLKDLNDKINSTKRLLTQDNINWKKKHDDFKKEIKTDEDLLKKVLK